MDREYIEALYSQIKKEDYICIVELINHDVGNYNEVKESIEALVSESRIAYCGQQYDKDYKRIFPVYTWSTMRVEYMAEKLKTKQISSQKTSIQNDLLKKLKDSGNFIKITQERELIKSDTQKINPKYFQLTNKDILSCYDYIIKDGVKILKEKDDARKAKALLEIQAARNVKRKAA